MNTFKKKINKVKNLFFAVMILAVAAPGILLAAPIPSPFQGVVTYDGIATDGITVSMVNLTKNSNTISMATALGGYYSFDAGSLIPAATIGDQIQVSASFNGFSASSIVPYDPAPPLGYTTVDLAISSAVLSPAKDILTFDFSSPVATGIINGTNISLTVPNGTAVTALVPTITISANATVSPVSGAAQNFTNPVSYTVTAQDGTTKVYTVTVTVAPAAPVLTSITVAPSPASIAVGSAQQFTATALDQFGVALNPQPAITWASANNAIATISASGLATGVSAGGPISISASSGAISGTANLTVTAATYTINSSAGANGAISPLGATVVNSGASQAYTITPNASYSVADVLIDGVSVGAVLTYTFTNVMANHTISASFALNVFSIVSSAGANGSINPAGTTSINSGANVTYTITPNVGYHIADVFVDGSSVGAVASYQFTNVTASHTISANFSVDILTISASAGAGGTVSPAGTSNINYGANQAYVISANGGYQIADVLVDGVPVGAVTAYTFNNVIVNHTISASFSTLPAAAVNLGVGWNLITLPLQPVDVNANNAPINYTAETFGAMIGADVVTQWSNTAQQYLSHIVGMPVGNFNITNGMGFFAHATAMKNASITGTAFPPVAHSLLSGWNSVGFNGAVATTANDFGLTLTGADVVAKFDNATQKWVSHIVNLPANNFSINPGDGVFVHKL